MRRSTATTPWIVKLPRHQTYWKFAVLGIGSAQSREGLYLGTHWACWGKLFLGEMRCLAGGTVLGSCSAECRGQWAAAQHGCWCLRGRSLWEQDAREAGSAGAWLEKTASHLQLPSATALVIVPAGKRAVSEGPIFTFREQPILGGFGDGM